MQLTKGILLIVEGDDHADVGGVLRQLLLLGLLGMAGLARLLGMSSLLSPPRLLGTWLLLSPNWGWRSFLSCAGGFGFLVGCHHTCRLNR
jgi:hypothetical protein